MSLAPGSAESWKEHVAMQSSRLFAVTVGALSLGATREPPIEAPKPSGATPSPEQ